MSDCITITNLTAVGLRNAINAKLKSGFRLVSVNFAEGEWVAWLASGEIDAVSEINDGVGMLIDNNAGLATGSEIAELHSTVQCLLRVLEGKILPVLEQR